MDATRGEDKTEELKKMMEDEAERSPVERSVISDAATLEVINTAIGTAVSIINMSDNKHVQDMAADIADSLIALTDVPDL